MEGGKVCVVIASHLGKFGNARAQSIIWAINSVLAMSVPVDSIRVSLSHDSENEHHAEALEQRLGGMNSGGGDIIVRRRSKQTAQCRHIQYVMREMGDDNDPAEWVLLLDDDDLVDPEILRTYAGVISTRPDLSLLICWAHINQDETGMGAEIWKLAVNSKTRICKMGDHSGSMWKCQALRDAITRTDRGSESRIGLDHDAGDCVLRTWGIMHAQSTTVCAPLVFRRNWHEWTHGDKRILGVKNE